MNSFLAIDPTGIYTLLSLIQQGEPLAVGMPYSDEENPRIMLANIASIEIPLFSAPISTG